LPPWPTRRGSASTLPPDFNACRTGQGESPCGVPERRSILLGPGVACRVLSCGRVRTRLGRFGFCMGGSRRLSFVGLVGVAGGAAAEGDHGPVDLAW